MKNSPEAQKKFHTFEFLDRVIFFHAHNKHNLQKLFLKEYRLSQEFKLLKERAEQDPSSLTPANKLCYLLGQKDLKQVPNEIFDALKDTDRESLEIDYDQYLVQKQAESMNMEIVNNGAVMYDQNRIAQKKKDFQNFINILKPQLELMRLAKNISDLKDKGEKPCEQTLVEKLTNIKDGSFTNLSKLNLSGSNLTFCNFRNMNLKETNFQNSDLTHSHFLGAHLKDVNIVNTKFTKGAVKVLKKKPLVFRDYHAYKIAEKLERYATKGEGVGALVHGNFFRNKRYNLEARALAKDLRDKIFTNKEEIASFLAYNAPESVHTLALNNCGNKSLRQLINHFIVHLTHGKFTLDDMQMYTRDASFNSFLLRKNA